MVLGVKFLSAGGDSSTLECHGGDLILGEAAITARVAVLYGNKRGAKLDKASIDRLGSGLKAEKAACGIADCVNCAVVVLSIHITISTDNRIDGSSCQVYFQ